MIRFIILFSLLVASVSGAKDFTVSIPDGAPVTKLQSICDILKVRYHKPTMTENECALRLILIGARSVNEANKKQALDERARQDFQTEQEAFGLILPMPAPGPTPTATPTATPTVTPTATPTPTPTVTP